jgi:hypothetical protein
MREQATLPDHATPKLDRPTELVPTNYRLLTTGYWLLATDYCLSHNYRVLSPRRLAG